MGTDQDCFCRIKGLYNTGGEEVLQKISRRRSIPRNRVEPAVEEAVVKMAFDNQQEANEEIETEHPNRRK